MSNLTITPIEINLDKITNIYKLFKINKYIRLSNYNKCYEIYNGDNIICFINCIINNKDIVIKNIYYNDSKLLTYALFIFKEQFDNIEQINILFDNYIFVLTNEIKNSLILNNYEQSNNYDLTFIYKYKK
jgi:hypothetical protein